MLEKLKLIFKRKTETDKRVEKILKDCGYVCYCKNCDNPLNDTSKTKTLRDSVYEYTCKECNTKSVFNFYIAPMPILIDG